MFAPVEFPALVLILTASALENCEHNTAGSPPTERPVQTPSLPPLLKKHHLFQGQVFLLGTCTFCTWQGTCQPWAWEAHLVHGPSCCILVVFAKVVTGCAPTTTALGPALLLETLTTSPLMDELTASLGTASTSWPRRAVAPSPSLQRMCRVAQAAPPAPNPCWCALATQLSTFSEVGQAWAGRFLAPQLCTSQSDASSLSVQGKTLLSTAFRCGLQRRTVGMA